MTERLTDAELDDLEYGAETAYTIELGTRAVPELRDLRAENERLRAVLVDARGSLVWAMNNMPSGSGMYFSLRDIDEALDGDA